MMSLIITVMAIALAALIVAGGVSYISSDLGIRTRIIGTLNAHYDALAMASSSFKNSNYGYAPKNLDQLSGFIEKQTYKKFPEKVDYLEWSIVDGDICLTKRETDSELNGVAKGVAHFAMSKIANSEANVRVGVACDNLIEDPDNLENEIIQKFSQTDPAALVLRVK